MAGVCQRETAVSARAARAGTSAAAGEAADGTADAAFAVDEGAAAVRAAEVAVESEEFSHGRLLSGGTFVRFPPMVAETLFCCQDLEQRWQKTIRSVRRVSPCPLGAVDGGGAAEQAGGAQPGNSADEDVHLFALEE